MKTDKQLQHDVLAELEWEPSVEASQIGVTAKNAVVTLVGNVAHYHEKLAAERAAKRVYGVQAVANDIEVRLLSPSQRTDAEIAAASLYALSWNTSVPTDRIQLTVRNGWITLEGHVDWQFQKQAAERAVHHLIGVKGVSNQIILTPQVQTADVQTKIENALRRSAELDAHRITVEAKGGKVTLRGTVRAWVEREEAQQAAWAAPGVTEVDNRITVAPMARDEPYGRSGSAPAI